MAGVQQCPEVVPQGHKGEHQGWAHSYTDHQCWKDKGIFCLVYYGRTNVLQQTYLVCFYDIDIDMYFILLLHDT